jgi:hypothetical protein
MNIVCLLAAGIEQEDAYLIPYLLGWTGEGEAQPWGAAMSFAMEVASGYGLIRGESDATPTELGKSVAKLLRARAKEQSGE